MNIYETPRLLDEYLLFHYGAADEVLPWDFGPREALGFPVRTVHELMDRSKIQPGQRALDLGCAVGRSSFELAAFGLEVLGVDFSASFILAAEALRERGEMPYQRHDEALQFTPLVARVPAGLPCGRVRFEVGDAMDLRADLAGFQVVHAANLLCRLPRPESVLARLPDLVAPGGQLLLTTPCTWLEEFTPPDHWPAGSTFDWLQHRLGQAFDLATKRDMPFLIREHARKFQWSVAMGTRWIRRS